jgi:UDP-glucose 4-epimerase
LPEYVDDCYLCPGNSRVSGKVNPQYRQTFVFDNDHPTPDGTPIRDYIRVADLGVAHILALDHLRAGQESERINLDN